MRNDAEIMEPLTQYDRNLSLCTRVQHIEINNGQEVDGTAANK